MVFGMVSDKDTEVCMRLLPKGERYHYIFTTPDTHRARTAQELLAMWEEAIGGPNEAMAIDDPDAAINYALHQAAPEDAVFIGGSNYLVGNAISRSTY